MWTWKQKYPFTCGRGLRKGYLKISKSLYPFTLIKKATVKLKFRWAFTSVWGGRIISRFKWVSKHSILQISGFRKQWTQTLLKKNGRVLHFTNYFTTWRKKLHTVAVGFSIALTNVQESIVQGLTVSVRPSLKKKDAKKVTYEHSKVEFFPTS